MQIRTQRRSQTHTRKTTVDGFHRRLQFVVHIGIVRDATLMTDVEAGSLAAGRWVELHKSTESAPCEPASTTWVRLSCGAPRPGITTI